MLFPSSPKSVRPLVAAVALGVTVPMLAACGGQTSSSAALPSALQSQNRQGASQNGRSADASGESAKGYSFTTLDDNADPAFNQLLGINSKGVIAGYFGSGVGASNPNKGYTLAPPYTQSNYTNENYPNSVQTQVTAINNKGYTAGFWVDGNGNNFGFVEWNGVFTSYADPKKGTFTQFLGINNSGLAVGFYTDSYGNNHGFEIQQGTTKYVPITPPNSVSVTAAAVNDLGDVVGFATNSSGATVSFLYKNKTYTEFSYPGSGSTSATGVNKSDEIVGVYTDSAGAMHGFTVTNVLKKAKFTNIDDPLGVGTTTVNGVNDAGDLVGFYVDSAGNTDGMLATP